MKTPLSEKSQVFQTVAESLGLQILEERGKGSADHDFSLRISSIPRPEGFSIRISEGLSSWKLDLNLDSFSVDLLKLFSQTFESRKDDIKSVLKSGDDFGISTNFFVNNKDIQQLEQHESWKNVEIAVLSRYFEEELKFKSLKNSLLHFLCLIIPLFTEDPSIENEEFNSYSNLIGEEEGALFRIATNRYERSRINRSRCLSFYGFSCQGCGLVLEEKYGPIGQGSIHVHHKIPVSQMGGSVVVNPISDLVPLCPNCHLIVHKKDPPLEVKELQDLVKNAKDSH